MPSFWMKVFALDTIQISYWQHSCRAAEHEYFERTGDDNDRETLFLILLLGNEKITQETSHKEKVCSL